jgi:hypothetical protein
MTSCNSTLVNEANEKLKEDAKNQKNFEYAYKTIPYPGDINQDIATTFIGTFAKKEDGTNLVENYMKKLPMQQTQTSCLVNAAHLATAYITETNLDTTAFGGTFTPSTQKTAGYTRAKLIKNVNDTRKTEYEDVETGPKYKKGMHLRLISGRYVNDANTNCFTNPQSCANNRVELDTAAADYKGDDVYLPSNFSNITTATSTNATPNKQPYSLPPNQKHQFMPEWSGYFKPNVSGEWNFSINSDDFSFLWIDSDGNMIGDAYNNDNSTVKDGGLHGMVRRDIPQTGTKTKSGRVNLTQDTYYRFRFRFGENWGGNDVVVQALPPGGNWISDLTGLVFVKTEEKSYTKKPVQTGTLEISYSTGTPETVEGQSLASIFNRSYSTTDPYPVYVSLEADKNTNLYNCYVNLPTDGATLSGVLSTAGNIPKYIVKTLWQSMQTSNAMPAAGQSTGGVVSVSDRPTIQLDGLDSFTYFPTQDNSKVPATRFKDGQHFIIIAESQQTTSTGKAYYIPSVILYDSTNERTYALDIGSMLNADIVKYLNYQLPMPEWASKPQFLVYDIDNIGSNTEGIKQTNALVQLNNNDYISSPNGYFRLLIQNGKLTLQAAIDPTITPDDPKKIEFTKNDISPGTYALHKINISSSLNQLNLLDKTSNSSYFIPASYMKTSDTNYTKYTDTYPNLPSAPTNHVTTDTQTVCAQKCSENPECDAYYSYKKNGAPGCKLQTFRNVDDMGFFNPQQANSTITDSALYVKNKEIKPDYNPKTFKKNNIEYTSYMDLKNTVLIQPANNTKTAFFPDNKQQSKVNGVLNPFDTYRDTIYTDWDKVIYENDNFNRNCTQQSSSGQNITDTGVGPTINQNYSDTAMSGFKNLEGYTSLYDTTYTTNCLSGAASTNGLCPSIVALEKANILSEKIKDNSKLLTENQSTLLTKIDDIDSKFIELSNLNNSNGQPNSYAPDFIGHDDTPDQTIQGALKKDINQMLLHENSLYVAGTIMTSSLLVLAIILSRG